MFSRRSYILFLTTLVCVGSAHADFVKVNTSFGANTALEDTATGITWLDLTLTNNQSFDSVQANLGAGGKFSGWQYATPEQLATFFNDYDQGVVSNVLALQLMNDLGGPLQTVYDPQSGFYRQSSIGLLDVPSI
jgi:hypothetical protein